MNLQAATWADRLLMGPLTRGSSGCRLIDKIDDIIFCSILIRKFFSHGNMGSFGT